MNKFKHVYGPIPSRRMGRSLGISPIPQGYCNYSCIYCQLGRTRHMTNSRGKYFSLEQMLTEFQAYSEGDIDFDVVTIVGEGEPLLYADIGILIQRLKKLTDKPVALITNGALLSTATVREEAKYADIVLPSLDACSQDLFETINRPHGGVSFEEMITGLRAFSHEYTGQLWIEVMLVKGVNDNRRFYHGLKELLDEINYHKLYLNIPVRPPAEPYASQPSEAAIEEAQLILGGIPINRLASEGFYSKIEDDYEAMLSIIKRHPMNQFEIRSFIQTRGNPEPERFFDRLNCDPKVEVVNYKNYHTYRLK